MTWTLPNLLTVLRLLAAPLIPVVFLYMARPFADWFALVLFVLAALTDFVDGWLARRWRQESPFGAMLDPIADKAMVMLTLMMLVAFWRLDPLVVLPATAIIFREVFVSGLREYLGDRSHLLRVTRLAKWKTTVQMIAIAALISEGLFAHYFRAHTLGMNPEIVNRILSGAEEDLLGIGWKYRGMFVTYFGGIALLWLAAALTLVTGGEYLAKAMPYLRGRKD
ncbi:MAG: CDP-diacylglycerol--glycerol-3-phosphate 3-phosphatidyltransferase [Alphaproteobacteria bacterium]|nr:MAG: CDP-diacylglycerol--glycerol-3-phosphate 3-phosphatidyltransferase [Alphaproteobacteria bacterium]